MRGKPLELPPFAVWWVLPTSDYYEGSVGLLDLEATLSWHSKVKPSLVHMLDSDALGRLPIAVFLLAFRKLVHIHQA